MGILESILDQHPTLEVSFEGWLGPNRFQLDLLEGAGRVVLFYIICLILGMKVSAQHGWNKKHNGFSP